MNRRTHARAGLTLAIVAIASLVPMAVMTTVAGAGAATEEYVLEVPGVSSSSAGVSGAAAGRADSDQVGVVGENAPPSSPLDAIGSALSEAPLAAGLLAAFAVLAGLVLAMSRATRSRSGTA